MYMYGFSNYACTALVREAQNTDIKCRGIVTVRTGSLTLILIKPFNGHSIFRFVECRHGRAYAIQCCVRLSVCDLCIVAKEKKLLLTAYRKSYMRNRLVPK